MIDDFSGGLNTRDGASNLPLSESSSAQNVHFDTGGEVSKRLAHSVWTDVPALPGAPVFLFYSSVLNLFFLQVGTQLYRAAPGAGAWTATGAVLASSSSIAMCDFGTRVVYCHTSSGTFTYNTAEGVLNRSATVKGNTIAVWQNYVWVAGDPTDTNTQSRLYRSKVGDPTTWAAPDGITVDMREKDSELLTALHGGPGLLVFKAESAYRVNDSSTGAFATLDWKSGCLSHDSLTAVEGNVYAMGVGALYEFSGNGPAVNVGDKLRPDLIADAVSSSSFTCAFSYQRRAFFSNGDRLYQYSPGIGALTKHRKYVSDGTLLGVTFYQRKPRAVANASPSLLTLFDASTSDDAGSGSGWTASWQSGFVDPAEGMRVRFRRLRVYGKRTGGSALPLNVVVRDAEAGTDTAFSTFTLDLSGSADLNSQTINALGQGHEIQFAISDITASSWYIRRLVLDYDVIEA